MHELELFCDAAHIPNEIHVPLDGLEIGDSIHIGQVKLPDGVTPANQDEDFTVATIVAPSAMKAEEEEAAAAGEVPTVEKAKKSRAKPGRKTRAANRPPSLQSNQGTARPYRRAVSFWAASR